MCLSTVYKVGTDGNKEEVTKNVASVKMENGEWVFTDLLGRRTVLKGALEQIDLMDNFITVKVG
jgi:predicted RNA-binding protein